MDALDKLIEAVEAGTADKDDHYAAFPTAMKGEHYHAWSAFNGSLDAALALHEALLPGCNQYSIVTDPTCLCVKVAWWPDGLSADKCCYGEGWSEDSPSRAWLLAILRAYRATTTPSGCGPIGETE